MKNSTTIIFEKPPVITFGASVGGNEESKGPMAEYFDKLYTDPYLGEESWEKAESRMQFNTVTFLLEKSGLKQKDISLMIGGDLINQCTSSYFAARQLTPQHTVFDRADILL